MLQNKFYDVKYCFSLRGILTCAKRGRHYVAETHKHGRFSYYRCSSAARYGLHCIQKMVPDKVIQDQVLQLFKNMQLSEEVISLAKLEEQQQKLLDDRKIVDIKWNDPFGLLYQSNPYSV